VTSSQQTVDDDPAPIEHVPEAYRSFSSRAVGTVPSPVRGFIGEAGGMAQLLGRILWSAVRHPTGYWGAVLDDMYQTLRRSWLPIALALFGFLLFMSILTVQFFAMVGASSLFGPLLYLQSVRSFMVWILTVVVAGVIGASLTTEIGTRKVREETDAMEVMGIDPIRELAVPRVVSVTLITVLLAVPSMIVTLVSMQAGASFVTHMDSAEFYFNVFSNLSPVDVASVLVNMVIAGLLIGTVCCYKGFAAAGGAIGLGRAVNQAVVIAFLGVFVQQLAYQALYFGLYPNVGAFR
jgi:phospholipid/cholesterol/gamma-HCH transport system permease protein